MKGTRDLVPALLMIVLLCAARDVRAQGSFGFGLVIGEPTGLAWKYKINHLNAVDGAIGFSPFDRFRLHVDYLWQSHPFQEEHLAVHYGLGPVIGFGETDIAYRHGNSYVLGEGDIGFGVRAVAGLTYTIPRSPVDLFVEMAPVVVAAPGPGLSLDVGLGARVYP